MYCCFEYKAKGLLSKVGYGLFIKLWVLKDMNGDIASIAKNSSNPAGLMAMVYRKPSSALVVFSFLTKGTVATLFFK